MSKQPTAAQRKRWSKVIALGCLICGNHATLHHLFTGAGGRKNHDRVAPLCPEHHYGKNGIDGRQKYSKKTWQQTFMTEDEMEARTNALLSSAGVDELVG